MPGWSNMVEAAGGWDNVVLANAFNPEYDKFQSRSIAEIAKTLGRDPADVAWDIMLGALPQRAYAFYFMMSDDDIKTALSFPWTSIGSDAAADRKSVV